MESVADSTISSPENGSCYEDSVTPLEEDGGEEVFTPPLQEEKERSHILHTRKDSGRVTKKSKY